MSKIVFFVNMMSITKKINFMSQILKQEAAPSCVFLELKRERGATDTPCPTFLCFSRTTTSTTTGFLLNNCGLPFNNIMSYTIGEKEKLLSLIKTY